MSVELGERRPRRGRPGETPCAEKITVAPCGTSSISSTKIAPRASRPATTWALVDDLLADVDRRAVLGERALDDLDCAGDSGTRRARGGQQHGPLVRASTRGMARSVVMVASLRTGGQISMVGGAVGGGH